MTPSPTHAPDPSAEGDADVEAVAAAQRRRRVWRVGTPAVLLLSGALFVVSGVNSQGTDLRPGRYADLASLVEADAADYDDLQQEAADLADEVDVLSSQVDDEQVRKIQRRADRLREPAGLEARQGPGVTVVLSDAPRDVFEEAISAEVDLRPFVVHQQDIQAVVNALWAGGASAVTIQGQRVVTTTGIKCEGNAVQLQGVPYPAPYTIQAVGDPTRLSTSLGSDPDVSSYRTDADRSDIAVGWDFEVTDDVEAPAFAGLVDITSARPLPVG